MTETSPPWSEPGWAAEVEKWLAVRLPPGRTITGPLDEVKRWDLSCVVRLPTTGGDVYVKSAVDSPLFVDEGAVIGLLHRHFPGRVPVPVAHSPADRLLALEAFPAELGWEVSDEVLAEAMGAYGRLQAATAGHVDELAAAGCGDRSLAWLAGQLTSWVAELDHTVVPAGSDPATWLSAREAEAIRSAVPELTLDVGRLAGYALPTTVIHGDLHLGNVARREGGFVFFDWTDAAVGHPFFDLISLHWQPSEAALEGYLSAWTAYEPRERLPEAWTLAKPLVAINQAISYLAILSVLSEPIDEHLAGLTAKWLRRFLATR